MRVCLLSVLGGALAASCRAPTEITLVVSTDVKCTDLRGTTITVGRLGEIEEKAPTTSSTFCDPSGDLGALVVVPSGGNTDVVAMKVIGGVGRDVESCVPPYGLGCIVARRAVQYLAHASLRVVVPLRAACNGVACGEAETCVAGGCASATIGDPTTCTGPGGCGEGALGPGASGGGDSGVGDPDGGPGADAGTDGGADAGPTVPATYNDVTKASSWSVFDATTVSFGIGGFSGATFDGRYLYFAPSLNSTVAARYDTQAPFGTSTSWTAFDTTNLTSGGRSYGGVAFDGRYVYFATYYFGAFADGVTARYDTQAPFATAASWTTFDTTTVNAGAKGFKGATFDGRYVYFVPYASGTGIVPRYDTQAPFATAASWTSFDVATLNAGAKSFFGAIFDGRYVYLIPTGSGAQGGLVARYDTQAPFGTAGSWGTFDMTTVNAGAKGFHGGGFDGRYVYFVPSYNGTYDGIVGRYDTQAPFGAAASWTTFDASTAVPGAAGLAGAGFDGRYMYFAPDFGGALSGRVARYDTQAPFATAASWGTFNTLGLNANAKGFNGAAFDGRYVYLFPGSTGIFARFDAKAPPSMPPLPSFSGSFQ